MHLICCIILSDISFSINSVFHSLVIVFKEFKTFIFFLIIAKKSGPRNEPWGTPNPTELLKVFSWKMSNNFVLFTPLKPIEVYLIYLYYLTYCILLTFLRSMVLIRSKSVISEIPPWTINTSLLTNVPNGRYWYTASINFNNLSWFFWKSNNKWNHIKNLLIQI